MARPTVMVNLGDGDKVRSAITRPSIADPKVCLTSLYLGDGTDDVHVSAAPRVLRRIAEELLDAADAACRREDAMTDPALPFVAVTE